MTPVDAQYDLIVIGSGPAGYVAAIRAAQLGMQVAVIEQEAVGGICLNWGCIPMKALVKSAQVFDYLQHAADFGIQVTAAQPDLCAMVQRSRAIAATMAKGIDYLFKKHNIVLLKGHGKVASPHTVTLTLSAGVTRHYCAQHIILATGGRNRLLPGFPTDGTKVMGYREALALSTQPATMLIIGGGAIGCEFAYFYHTIGTKVTLVERQPYLLSLEDEAISKQVYQSFTKSGMQVYTAATVTAVDVKGANPTVTIHTAAGEISLACDTILSAVGIMANVENIGLEENGILIEQGKIVVDAYYRTSCERVYAIGDVIKGPALAHVASAEAIICVEKIAGLDPEPLDYHNIPTCTYITPEVASVGYTEKAAQEAGYSVKVGVFPFSASGKAHTAGASEGFVKVIFDAQYGEWLGAHMVGTNVAEMISEVVVARKLETTAHEIQNSVHPHPTMSEAIMEAVAAAYGGAIHI
ncbi:dihydrolipoyl dehydrogenase [Candidatus Cardinium hertigii]|nr:dihydrolipoyl dehydrogenase [Candidatus Cardinium hertigii]